MTVQNLQHADGWAALQNGAVDAWAGLDPIMAGAEAAGATLLYRNIGFNSYGFLNATESFLQPSRTSRRPWSTRTRRPARGRSPTPTRPPRSWRRWRLDVAIATKVIKERTNLAVDPVPGQTQIDVLTKIGPVFVESGDVASQDLIDAALATIINDHVRQDGRSRPDPGRLLTH